MTITEKPLGDEAVAAPRPDATSVAVTVTVGVGLLVLIVLISAVHLVQGTAAVGVSDLWDWMTGTSEDQATAVVVDSRLPRLAAGVLVGIALGAAGAVMQSISRNVLASPDTLAVDSGAYLALTAAAAAGLNAPLLGNATVAFVGGTAAAGLVFALSGTEYGTVRLVLAGSAVSLALISATRSLLILFPYESRGLHAWSGGSIAQNGFDGIVLFAPIVAVVFAILLMYGRSLDLMMLGDDQARALGVRVRRTQLTVLLLAVMLSASAVTLTGPIGFVGLAAPALVRLAIPHVKGLHRHRALIPMSALTGVIVVLGSDAGLRAAIGSQGAVEVPTGIITSIVGAFFLVVFAFRLRPAVIGTTGAALDVRGTGSRHPVLVAVTVFAALFGAIVAGLLLGDARFLLGDLLNWATGNAGPVVSNVMDSRVPRVVAALLAGAALAVAGAVIQAVTRNPLAEPAIIGVSGGASVAAVMVVTFIPLASFWYLAGASAVGAIAAAVIVFGLSARGGLMTDRLVLVGIGVSAASASLVTLLIVATDPFNAAKALTWLSGSTYGRSFEQLVPLSIGCLVLFPLILVGRRQLDLLSVDEDTPRVLGVNVPKARFGLLLCAVLLTAVAVAGIGVIGFVGLIAPHAARALVGRRHTWALPTAAALGATLVVLADTLGRTVIAPSQLPAGLLTAVIGGPYFFWLLYRSRVRSS